MRFKTASFRFADADENTLENLDFTCKRGETTAIIGSTGSGKSTIAKLTLRFHDVTSGSVLLNGKDIRSMTQKELRDHISYVPQKAWLFSGTIADNLRHGNGHATEQQMKRALSVAQSEFVYELPDGLYSRVSQGGTNFSGGQKQRLCIARALLKKPKILILDDSTSAVDTATEAKIRESFAGELKNTTKIIIAQRISSVQEADEIMVLDDGKIVGFGKHEDLLASCEAYQEIYYSQMDKEKEGAAS